MLIVSQGLPWVEELFTVDIVKYLFNGHLVCSTSQFEEFKFADKIAAFLSMYDNHQNCKSIKNDVVNISTFLKHFNQSINY